MLPDSVRVRVPATTANLGPGFDACGLALSWYDDIVVCRRDDDAVTLIIDGEGMDVVGDVEANLIVRTLQRTLAERGAAVGGLDVRCHNRIPHGRGLGSSAAAIVAGVALGHALAGGARDREAVLRAASRAEGHPDNVAACIYGGVTVAWLADDDPSRAGAIRLDPIADLAPVVCVPEWSLPTATARAALPTHVPHADAAYTAGRAALLIAALTTDPRLLLEATDDRLHQPYRAAVMPPTAALIASLRAVELPAAMSGAGPSVLVLHDPERRTASVAGHGWRVVPLDVDRAGLRVDIPVDAEGAGVPTSR